MFHCIQDGSNTNRYVLLHIMILLLQVYDHLEFLHKTNNFHSHTFRLIQHSYDLLSEKLTELASILMEQNPQPSDVAMSYFSPVFLHE